MPDFVIKIGNFKSVVFFTVHFQVAAVILSLLSYYQRRNKPNVQSNNVYYKTIDKSI